MIRLGLVGRKLGHSYSRFLFTEKFAALGIEGEYAMYELENIKEVRDIVRQHRLNGFNVTIPYKESIIPLLDRIDPKARAIGAVNTVSVSDDTTLTGYNTDIDGFDALLNSAIAKHWYRPRKSTPSAVILGTGGAAKSVAYVLSLHNADITLISRSTSPLGWIKKAGYKQASYSELTDSILYHTDIIVNATPLGMYPDTDAAPPINYDAIQPHSIALDLIYNPQETKFMKLCLAHGVYTANGMRMLEVQAEEAWKIWHDTT